MTHCLATCLRAAIADARRRGLPIAVIRRLEDCLAILPRLEGE